MTARVPPHNLDAERSLLGAMLLTKDARDDAFGKVTEHDLYKPAHRLIFAAIEELATDSQPVDCVTVADQLGRNGQLDDAGGLVGLIAIQTDTPASTNAGRYATIVADAARQRRLLGMALEIGEAIHEGLDPSGLVARMGTEVIAASDDVSTWQPVDLGPVLEGLAPERPMWLKRADGAPLLYKARTHAFNGEPEAGKSWLALVPVAEAITSQVEALYIDFEDTPHMLVDRLRSLGIGPGPIIDYLVYVRPQDPLDAGARMRLDSLLAAHLFAVAVLDGVAQALALCGWDENSNTDVANFFAALPDRLANAGAATILIDHVVKNKEGQGRYGRGAGAKLAKISGVTYKLETIKPFGRGLTGRSRLVLNKDRVGWVRQTAGGNQHIAEFVLHSQGDGSTVRAELVVPTDVDGEGHWVPTGTMEKISRALEGQDQPLTFRQVDTIVPGRTDVKQKALAALVDAEHVQCLPGPRNTMLYRLKTPFHDPQDDDGSPMGDPPDYMLYPDEGDD